MSARQRVSPKQALALLDFAGRPDAGSLSAQLVDQQLDGAVAAHNLLQTVGVAYVADEVGTGKTLVAAGALALLRHHDPGLRALVITPRVNLQDKWQRELQSFARHNVRYTDLRVRGLGGEPVRPPRVVSGLKGLLAAWDEQPDCDVITRLSSFQLGHRQTTPQQRGEYVESWRPLLEPPGGRVVSRLLDDAARGRGHVGVKDTIAACVNRLLPEIGVLVVDEAHNLKGGIEPLGAARNRVVWTLLGHNPACKNAVPGYGPKVERVLMLSATPMEDDTEQLLRQLQVLGVDHRVPLLAAEDEQTRLDSLRTFLFRRLTKLRVGDDVLTRNRYREEWRLGGAVDVNESLSFDDVKARLTFALVQKKVADVLNTGGGGRHFQIGMLTSFESLAESTSHARAGLKSTADPAEWQDAAFDDTEQNRIASEDERKGIDEDGIRDLVASHQTEFGRPPSHPKMDAVVNRLVAGARQGRKALVFTRRVGSVDELVQRVNDGLDADLKQRLRQELPGMAGELDKLFVLYDEPRSGPAGDLEPAVPAEPTFDLFEGDQDLADDDLPEIPRADVPAEAPADVEATEEMRGGTSLFEWLFRGSGAAGLLTGSWLRQRLEQQSGGYVTLLRDNHVAAVLTCEPPEVMDRLANAVTDVADPAALVDQLAQRYLGTAAQPSTLIRFRAAQLAGLHVLDQHGSGATRDKAAHALLTLASSAPTSTPTRERPIPVADRLTEVTLATALRSEPDLCGELWHPVLPWSWTTAEAFQEREWRWRLFATAVRLDFPALDLWLSEVRRRGTLAASDGRLDGAALIAAFLQTLLRQRDEPAKGWTSYAALRALAIDANLVLEVNGVQRRHDAVPAWIGNRVPAVGMSGRVNRTAVQQFRTPTYPLVLISTDLLQEGEDLHTFCDEVHHYGIAWMPSSLEQRTGRVDRVNSLTERRLSRAEATLDSDGRPPSDHRLNVLYPFVSGTYEQLQVRRVLDRVDEHVRLLHESFGQQVRVSPRIDVDMEVVDDSPMPQPVTNLGEPYKIDPAWFAARRSRSPVMDASAADDAEKQFGVLIERTTWGGYPIDWLTRTPRLHLLGECRLGDRVQPLDLRLTTLHGRAAVRIVTPVGLIPPEGLAALVTGPAAVYDARLGVVRLGPRERRTFSVTVEDLVLVPERSDLGRFLEPRIVSVLRQGDELELALLRSDRPLTEFAADLTAEVSSG